MEWVVVVNQTRGKQAASDLSKLTAFGPMSEEEADSFTATVSNGVDEEQRAMYDILWVAAVPFYPPTDDFDSILADVEKLGKDQVSNRMNLGEES